MENIRKAGILLHPTSLPNDYGIGTFGPEAYAFVDFLKKAGQNIWQILPLGPTGPGDSPYQCYSAFALDPILIDLTHFVKKGRIENADLKEAEKPNTGRIDYAFVNGSRSNIFKKAHDAFEKLASQEDKAPYDDFIDRQSYWLDDYALFMAIKETMKGLPWYEWPDELRLKEAAPLAHYKETLSQRIKYHKYLQFVANCQWLALKEYANKNNIEIIGDIPLYVSFDSSDAWANPEVFMLDENLTPDMVAGVPPDFFSETGQLWGNVLFNWDHLKQTGFDWWIKRISYNLELADIIRIDHFRGLVAFWAVPFKEETAINGQWIDAPGDELFEALFDKLGELPIIAEDLGVITPDVDALREKYKLPGMKILQFGFDEGDSNGFLPHFYHPNSVVYTGTHDNDTVMGWYNQLNSEVKLKFHQYAGSIGSGPQWLMIRLAWASVSQMAIVPLQDVMGLATDSRMNTPGTLINNWQWRYFEGQLPDEYAHILLEFSKLYNRIKPERDESITN
jgi:4-alpha-glucanotransferase